MSASGQPDVDVVRPVDRRPRRTGWLLLGVAAVLAAGVSVALFSGGSAPGKVLEPAAAEVAPSAESTPLTARSETTASGLSASDSTESSAATIAPSVDANTGSTVPPPVMSGVVTYSTSPGSDGGAALLGLPPTNTYPYHSTGSDWAGLATWDPRCLPILRNQRVLELPDLRGMTRQQVSAAIEPIMMYSYCTSGTIIMVQFVNGGQQCTPDEGRAGRVVTQSPAAGARVAPAIYPVTLSWSVYCPEDTTTSIGASAPPPPTTSPPEPVAPTTAP